MNKHLEEAYNKIGTDLINELSPHLTTTKLSVIQPIYRNSCRSVEIAECAVGQAIGKLQIETETADPTRYITLQIGQSNLRCCTSNELIKRLKIIESIQTTGIKGQLQQTISDHESDITIITPELERIIYKNCTVTYSIAYAHDKIIKHMKILCNRHLYDLHGEINLDLFISTAASYGLLLSTTPPTGNLSDEDRFDGEGIPYLITGRKGISITTRLIYRGRPDKITPITWWPTEVTDYLKTYIYNYLRKSHPK